MKELFLGTKGTLYPSLGLKAPGIQGLGDLGLGTHSFVKVPQANNGDR